LYEAVFRHALFPAYETLVKRRSTARYMAEYEVGQWLVANALQSLQLRKLNALLDHCWRHVPFLQGFWRDAGCRPGALGHLDELARYPTMTKSVITANYEAMIAVPWRGRTLTKTTGGSTGDPFRFEYTMDVYARRTAVMWRGYGWAGARLGTRTAYLWGTGLRKGGWGGIKDRLYHKAFNRRFLDAFTLSGANIDQRIDEIARYRPHALVGYVTPIVIVARRMIETGRAIGGLRGVLTGAEALYAPEREIIERAFGCRAFDTYGAREVMLMASECDHHRGLHVNADHLLLETQTSDRRPAPPGEAGDVAITDFHNYGMPMVRYLNGDRATYSGAPCSCGRGLPLLQSVDGRVLDLIQTPDGRHVPGEFFVYAMLDWPTVRQWQVVQTAADCVEFRLVVSEPFTPAMRERLMSKVRSTAGTALRVEIHEVDVIPPTPSGKRRLTISLANSAPALDRA
jgi:phenylacetate-CoA ligase